MESLEQSSQTAASVALPFYEHPQVHVENLPYGPGIPFGVEQVSNPALGIGGCYGSWGKTYDNETLPMMLEERMGALDSAERLNLAELGFVYRQHLPSLTDEEHLALELEVGERYLRSAIETCGWQPDEVEGVLIGCSAPVSNDFVEQIARRAGIREQAIKVSVHKACDGSVGGINLALNHEVSEHLKIMPNLARKLYGKKVLVGGIEGLSRFMRSAYDANALQLFGNAAGVIGIIPGQTMNFLAGKTHEVFDTEGVLQVRMHYPHAGPRADGSMIDVTWTGENVLRVAGFQHEPSNDSTVVMAGPMGMVKLFVRTGVQVVSDVYHAYRKRMDEIGQTEKTFAVAIVHHANYKINLLKERHLQKEGIQIPMPWLLNEFGNVSAASNMIAFLRQLPKMQPGDHILIDGFGAGTYYDVVAVELPGV